jgi:hypothetical protein
MSKVFTTVRADCKDALVKIVHERIGRVLSMEEEVMLFKLLPRDLETVEQGLSILRKKMRV